MMMGSFAGPPDNKPEAISFCTLKAFTIGAGARARWALPWAISAQMPLNANTHKGLNAPSTFRAEAHYADDYDHTIKLRRDVEKR